MGWFPRFVGTMSHYDFLGAFSPHFVAFMRRYLGTSEFRPRSASDAGPADHPGVCGTGCSRPVDFEEPSGSPKFPGNPLDHSPCSPTPAGSSTRCGTRGQRTRHGPRLKPRRGLPRLAKFSGLNHTAFGLAVYASWWRSPAPARKTRFRLLVPALPGGIRTRRVPTKGFRVWLTPSSFPELPWGEVCFVELRFSLHSRRSRCCQWAVGGRQFIVPVLTEGPATDSGHLHGHRIPRTSAQDVHCKYTT